MSNATWLYGRGDCESPIYLLVQVNDATGATSPLDITGYNVRVEVWDAAHTGSGYYSNDRWRATSSVRSYDETPLLTGTNLDGTFSVITAANGSFRFAISDAQSRQLIDSSWSQRRIKRPVNFLVYRTDDNKNALLYDQVHWVYP